MEAKLLSYETDGFSLEECHYGDSWSIYLHDEDVSIGTVPKKMTYDEVRLLVRFWRKGVLHGETIDRLKVQAEMRKAMGVFS